MVVLMKHIFTRFNVLLIIAGVLASSLGASLATALQAKPQVIEIFVERFSFTPSEFHVKAGAPVEIRLRSDDTDHGFRIIGTEVDVQIPKRRRGETVVTYTADTVGRFIIECSRPCGAGHTSMRATLVVK